MTIPAAEWPTRLEAAIASIDGRFKRIFVFNETASTQDAARRMKARAGDVILALRQTAGRGRLGRAWADTSTAGLAMSFVIPAGPPERLAISCAIGTAWAAESLLSPSLSTSGGPSTDHVGIKWPNDIVARRAGAMDRRKLAGILIEQHDDVAVVGVGLNVTQTAWPPELADIAVSLAELGANVDRLDAAIALMRELDRSLAADDAELLAAFTQRDVLCGTAQSFTTPTGVIRGVVRRIDPMSGLLIENEHGELWLPAATTSVT